MLSWLFRIARLHDLCQHNCTTKNAIKDKIKSKIGKEKETTEEIRNKRKKIKQRRGKKAEEQRERDKNQTGKTRKNYRQKKQIYLEFSQMQKECEKVEATKEARKIKTKK